MLCGAFLYLEGYSLAVVRGFLIEEVSFVAEHRL